MHYIRKLTTPGRLCNTQENGLLNLERTPTQRLAIDGIPCLNEGIRYVRGNPTDVVYLFWLRPFMLLRSTSRFKKVYHLLATTVFGKAQGRITVVILGIQAPNRLLNFKRIHYPMSFIISSK